jgi:hypothetical protein
VARYLAQHLAALTEGKQTPGMEVRFETTSSPARTDTMNGPFGPLPKRRTPHDYGRLI